MTVELGSKQFWQDIRTDPAKLAADVCSIDVANLDDTLEKHPALRAWVIAAYELSRIEESKLKWEETKTRARVLLGIERKDPKTEKPKTVQMIEAELENNPQVIATTERLHAHQEVKAGLRAMAEALDDRRDMLIQIAAKQRKELEDYK